MKKEAISVDNLTLKYNSNIVLSNISFKVYEKDFFAILGQNGAGKTTLLKSIIGLKDFDKGDIKIFSEKINSMKKIIGYVPQDTLIFKNFPISVLEVVLTGTLSPNIKLFYKYKKEDFEIAKESLEKVNIYKLKDKRPCELSGGEFQKMLIARAISVNPKILILDEPTSGVDTKSKEQIFALLRNLNKDITIVLVTHEDKKLLTDITNTFFV